MDILVVCKELRQAEILYWQFINCLGIPARALERLHKTCTYTGVKFQFVTEAQLDIVQQGRHDVKILSGDEVYWYLLKQMHYVR